MKITMVGASGSGKTSYMSALYESLGTNKMSGFHVIPAGNTLEETVIAKGNWQALALATRNFEFPLGTARTTLWSFDLRYHEKFVCNYEWIDYRGGILTDIASENLMSDEEKKREVNELISHIALSNAVILFADSLMLTYYPNINHARFRSGAQIINDIFDAYNTFLPDRNLIFVIALTKADTVEDKWKKNNYEGLIQRGLEAFSPIINICRRNPSWIGGIVPISVVGEGNAQNTIQRPPNIQSPVIVKTEIINFPEPLNAGHTLFFCLGQTLKLMQQTANRNIDQYEREIEKALNQSGLLNDLATFFTGKPSARDIARTLLVQRTEENNALRKFEPYVDPLYINALEKVKLI